MANTYKDTMNLPQTDFPMRGNLPASEPERLRKWEGEHLYESILAKNKDGKPFVLHDGPPYANGPIHIGHSFNKILKDFVVKSHAQRGFFTPYVPGWDCHGQPIEHMVEKSLGPEKMAQTDQPTLRRLCREWAQTYVDVQRDGFKRLGVNGDWGNPYLTFLPNYEAGNVEIFKELYLAGQIYRGRKPIHWCKRCHTALAEAEIEYADLDSPSIFVRFKMDVVPGVFEAAGAEGDAYVLIWTTTPWTLPANTAVSLAPEADYVMVQADGANMIMARALVESVAEAAGWQEWSLVSQEDGEPVVLKGKQLCGLTYTCPIRQDLKGTIIYGDHVTLETGTGAVHTAPGHGQDDYLVALEFDVPLLMPVDDNGVLTADAGPFAGLDVFDANPVIIEWLSEQGTLVAKKVINHSYPTCWRCHEPVIFRATSQWFVSMDKNSLREKALDAVEDEVQFHPAWSQKRIEAMVGDRPDWCISRQRSWGVPIPVFSCAKCGETVATEESFDAVIELFYEYGADAWFTKQPSEYLPRTVKCEKCGCSELVPDKNILDVWWESGVSHTSVLKHRAAEGLTFPADVYLEGSDQHRGWFQSSLLTSIGAYGVPPFKHIVSCGFTVDEFGRKMSKSLGNGLDPAEVIDTYGADVLRLWAATVDYGVDVSIADSILKQVAGDYRRYRNCFRFLLGSLSDFDDRADAVDAWEALEPIDRYMLAKTAKLLDEVEQAYDEFRYNGVYRLTFDFVNDLSAVYMDVAKDRLYAEAPNSPRRRAVQTVLANILEVLVRVLSPIISFTADEVWEHYPEPMRRAEGRPSNVQLAGWPSRRDMVPALPADGGKQALASFACALEARDAVTKALEEARVAKLVNKSQEAAVRITAPAPTAQALRDFGSEVLEELFIVSGVEVLDAAEGDDAVAVEVLQAPGEKCPRCWNYRQLGTDAAHPDVCGRCAAVLDEIGFKA